MTQYRILTFAAAADIVGGNSCFLELPAIATVGDLRAALRTAYPEFDELSGFAIARNEVYATDEETITPDDELVIIPPVSGG